jgi:hypothetical protein
MSFNKSRTKPNALSNGLKPLSTPTRPDSGPAALNSDAELGLLEILIREGYGLQLSPAAKPYISCTVNGSDSHSPAPIKYINSSVSNPIWDATLRHTVATLDPNQNGLSLSLFAGGSCNALLGVCRLLLPDKYPTERTEYSLTFVLLPVSGRTRLTRDAASKVRRASSCQAMSESPSSSPQDPRAARISASRTLTS